MLSNSEHKIHELGGSVGDLKYIKGMFLALNIYLSLM